MAQSAEMDQDLHQQIRDVSRLMAVTMSNMAASDVKGNAGPGRDAYGFNCFGTFGCYTGCFGTFGCAGVARLPDSAAAAR